MFNMKNIFNFFKKEEKKADYKKINALLDLLRIVAPTGMSNNKILEKIGVELGMVTDDSIRRGPAQHTDLRDAHAAIMICDRGKYRANTAKECIEFGVTTRTLDDIIEKADMHTAQMNQDLKKWERYKKTAIQLKKELNEMADLHDLVQEDYKEILADLYLRNGDTK